MREVAAFWGHEPDSRVSCPDDRGASDWTTLRLDRAPEELRELLEGRPLTLPTPAPVAGDPLWSGRDAAGREVVLAARKPDGGVELAIEPDSAVAALTSRAALSPSRPTSARLPFHYHRVPPGLRRRVRDVLVSRRLRRARDGFPAWPVEPSVEAVRRLWLAAWRTAGGTGDPAAHWPDGRAWTIALTHDVDSGDGLAVGEAMAAAEEERGLRSCWYVVGDDWPIDHERLGRLHDAGHEIGLHDAHHDNRGPFLAPAELGARLDACAALRERYGMRGFRSPSMLRTEGMYEALEGRFDHDSSMPDTGLLPKPNGCATVFPLERRGVSVLPLSVPPDGQLVGLGLSPDEVVERWIEKARWVARAGGLAMLLTHPEPGFSAEPRMQAAYARFLDWAASRTDAWVALPHQVAAHWKRRADPAHSG